MIRNGLTTQLGLRVPVLNAPMTPQAGGALARAVAQNGGLGMLGFDEDESVESISEQLAILTAAPCVPFGIGLVAWVLERRPQLLELAIAARPQLISISFGDPAPYAQRVRDAGILLGSQVQSRERARTAIDAGTDIIIAQGSEAGGHTGAVGTLPLLQIVLEMTDRPVVAAGGIATGRGLAAVIAAGAAGALIGTPFLLAHEARNTGAARERIAASDETQTIYTRVYDRVQNKGWPHEFGGRALRTAYLEKWTGRESELMASASDVAAFKPDEKIYAGQSVGMLREVRSAGEIIDDLARDADACLRRAAMQLE